VSQDRPEQPRLVQQGQKGRWDSAETPERSHSLSRAIRPLAARLLQARRTGVFFCSAECRIRIEVSSTDGFNQVYAGECRAVQRIISRLTPTPSRSPLRGCACPPFGSQFQSVTSNAPSPTTNRRGASPGEDSADAQNPGACFEGRIPLAHSGIHYGWTLAPGGTVDSDSRPRAGAAKPRLDVFV